MSLPGNCTQSQRSSHKHLNTARRREKTWKAGTNILRKCTNCKGEDETTHISLLAALRYLSVLTNTDTMASRIPNRTTQLARRSGRKSDVGHVLMVVTQLLLACDMKKTSARDYHTHKTAIRWTRFVSQWLRADATLLKRYPVILYGMLSHSIIRHSASASCLVRNMGVQRSGSNPSKCLR